VPARARVRLGPLLRELVRDEPEREGVDRDEVDRERLPEAAVRLPVRGRDRLADARLELARRVVAR